MASPAGRSPAGPSTSTSPWLLPPLSLPFPVHPKPARLVCGGLDYTILHTAQPQLNPPPTCSIKLFVPGSNGTLWLVHLHERCAQRIEVGHELATAVAIGDFTEQKTLEVLAAGFDGAISVLSIGLEPDARMAWPGSAAPVPPFISPLHASHSVLVDGILQGNALVRKSPTVDAPYFELTFHIEAHDQASAPEFHVLVGTATTTSAVWQLVLCLTPCCLASLPSSP